MPSIAILGCGLIGETHARILSDLGASPVLFADAAHERAEELASRYGGRAITDPFAAVRDPEVEAVYICTYHDTHARLAIEAAQQGKHIFLEKPMALTESECSAIEERVKKAGVQCMSGFKLRYYSLTRKAKALLVATGRTPLVLSAHVIDRRWPDDSWANDPVRGGGNVLSQGCHAVDLLCYLAGSTPVRISAEGGNLHHTGLDIVDAMTATLRFANGAIATLTVGDVGEMPHDGKFSVMAMNGRETVHLYDRLTSLSYHNGAEEQVFRGDEDGFLHENIEFLAALNEGRAPETTEHDGALATRVLLAGIRAIRTGEAQTIR